MHLYPNPGSTQVTLALPDDVRYPLHYDINTMTGMQVETGVITSDAYTTLSTSWLAAGMYILRVRDNGGKIWAGKWVKE
ncbi:MAG: T9SS type A sorting domain-containing protein [Chitinophagales bacterium]|nr:T9SS type A sorting domain-containing protein [Chitinophagales bacterium]